MRSILLYIYLMVVISTSCYAQISRSDSIADVDRSLYDLLYKKSQKNRFSKELYNLILTDNSIDNSENIETSGLYSEYDGDTIASIIIVQKSIFPTDNKISILGNKLHKNSTTRWLAKQIIFKEGDIIDPKMISEGLSRLRDKPQIKDAKLIFIEDPYRDKVVRAIITVQDRFSYGIDFVVNGARSYDLSIENINVAGIGTTVAAHYILNVDSKDKHGFKIDYAADNILNRSENISTSFEDSYDKKHFESRIDKNFISSSKPQYAGGARYNYTFRDDQLPDYSYLDIDTTVTYQEWSTWIGKSLNIKNSTLYLGAKFGDISYPEPIDLDEISDSIISDKSIALGYLSIGKRDLYQSKNILSFGITEDIPYGYYLEYVGGVERNGYGDRLYSHLSFVRSIKMMQYGLLSLSTDISGYLNKKQIEQAMVKLRINYFTHLINYKRVSFRQFISFEYTKGINRFEGEKIGFKKIDNRTVIRGFSSDSISGTEIVSASAESVIYLAKSWYGFRFAPYGFIDIGAVGDSKKAFKNLDVYGGVGFGLRVHNESLAISAIQLGFYYYPKVPTDHRSYSLSMKSVEKQNLDNLLGREPEQIEFK